MKKLLFISVILVLILLVSCSSKEPVLDNETSVKDGEDSQNDVSEVIDEGELQNDVSEVIDEEELNNYDISYEIERGESFEEVVADGIDVISNCESVGGSWLAEYKECEYMNAQDCSFIRGAHNHCASSCRHKSGDVNCIEECVGVCALS